MRDRLEILLGVGALVAVGLVWIPVLPWGMTLALVMGAGLLMPRRVFVGGPGGEAPGAAVSALLIAATTRLVAEAVGDFALAARIAFSAWVLAGTAAHFLRRPAPFSDPPHDRLTANLVLPVMTAAVIPLLFNPSLWMRTEARLFLPLVAEAQGGAFPAGNPFLAGADGTLPWMYAALLAPFRSLTSAPAHVLLGVFQWTGLVLLLDGAGRWAMHRGGGRWAIIALPPLLVGGLTVFGFRGWAGLPDLTRLGEEPLLRAMTGLAGDPTVSGLFPLVWGAGPIPWTLACLAGAGSLAEGPRFRLRPLLVGMLLGLAILLHPAVGITAAGMWFVLRLTEPRRAVASPHSTGGRRETMLSAAVAALVAAPYVLSLPRPFLSLPLALPAPPSPSFGVVLVEALPLFLAAAGALIALRERRGWILALGVGAGWGLLNLGSAGGAAPFLWSALLFAGIPAALGLERLARRAWGLPVTVAILLLFLVTPALLLSPALRDRSGEPRWTEEERNMLGRADRAIPEDAVLLTLPTRRATSEEQVLLCRPAYLGPRESTAFAVAAGDTSSTRTAENRRRLLMDFVQGRESLAVLDRIAAEMAPRPLFFVVSSEDAGLHAGLVDIIFPTAVRFAVVENSETLKILAYMAPAGAEAVDEEKKPPAPRIILTPGEGGTVEADTIGVIEAATEDSTGAPGDAPRAPADSSAAPGDSADIGSP